MGSALNKICVKPDNSDYDFDLVVIGGGSGGLAASKEASKLGKRVALCDYVNPTPLGTYWGLGGTCVNVGCIPKKLMHHASLLGEAISDAPLFGWQNVTKGPVDWATLIQAVQDYIQTLNWSYRTSLKKHRVKITYFNAFAQFVDPHTLRITKEDADKKEITSKDFIIAVGGRPNYPDIPGAKEFCITSDDLFSLPYSPGITLCIGASYIALECAGFLNGIGIETSILVRSIVLRGFDQQMAELITNDLEERGVNFYKGWIPTKITKIEDGNDSKAPTLEVSVKRTSGDETMNIVVNTVLLAIGRFPATKQMNLETIGVNLDVDTGKITVDKGDTSSVKNIYAIGDVAEGRPELTPTAVQAGVLLARRLYGRSKILTDYINFPTTVFTPVEYGCIGLSEEAAKEKYGRNNIEVYHKILHPLEWTFTTRQQNSCYAKLICYKSKKELVVGFHYFGPNAGEVTQGFTVCMKMGATKADFDSTIGIHPTMAEVFTTMEDTKASGKASIVEEGC